MRKHFPFIFLFIFFLVVGLIIYKDYGISWDEPISRENNGVLNYQFIKDGNSQPILIGNEKYHGPVFEIFLVGVEHLLNLSDSRDIYLMRHLVTFILFAISVLVFYLFLLKYFNSASLALIGAAFLVLSPRIFADAFYNSKDLAFLSFTIFSLSTTLNFLERKNFRAGILNALITAVLIDIRIMGIIFPCFLFLFLFIDFIKDPFKRRKIVIQGALFLLFLALFVILFWPVMWLNPLNHFILAWKEMTKYPWDGSVFFNGKSIYGTNLPWDYIPVWILITTPLLYILFFAAGIFFLIRQFFKNFKLSNFEFLNLYTVFLPVLAVIFLHSVVYDGWRHLYFIYPSFIVLTVIGLQHVKKFSTKYKNGNRFLNTSIFIYCFLIAYLMYNLHPYQQVYFNYLAGISYGEARKKFEGDYWGLSYKDGLEHVLSKDTSQNIVVFSDEIYPASNNLKILKTDERMRVSMTNEWELADYFMTTFRYHFKPEKFNADVNIMRDKGVVLSIFDIRKRNITHVWDQYRINHFATDFENDSASWIDGKITNDVNSFSGQMVRAIDSSMTYAQVVTLHPENKLMDTMFANYIDVKFQIKTPDSFETGLVIQVDSGEGKMYYWTSYPMKLKQIDKWTRKEFRMKLPEIFSTSDVIKIYLWNFSHNLFYIDDLDVSLYSVPREIRTRVLENSR